MSVLPQRLGAYRGRYRRGGEDGGEEHFSAGHLTLLCVLRRRLLFALLGWWGLLLQVLIDKTNIPHQTKQTTSSDDKQLDLTNYTAQVLH